VRTAVPYTLVLMLAPALPGVLSRAAPPQNLLALGLPAGVGAAIAALIVALANA
jgi:flagellar biosynthesis protein FliR